MIKVIDPGFYTTVQDVGRLHFKAMGIPESGCMDQLAAHRANTLAGNEKGAAVLEITMTGPVLQFMEPTCIAISGATFDIFLDNRVVDQEELLTIVAGQTLTFGKLQKGFRAYLAVAGGIQSKEVFGSRSYFYPLTEKQRLGKGDHLPIITNSDVAVIRTLINQRIVLEAKELYVLEGPEFDRLSKQQQAALFETEFKVSNRNNRMAYQFEPSLDPLELSVITCPVLPGTIQLTPQGLLFALMRDGQTTGGYPRVLQLTHGSINALAQLHEGSTFHFKMKDR